MSRRPVPSHPDEFPVIVKRHLDWSELDAFGHANNARYFTWFEEARMAYFINVGVPTDVVSGWGPILAHTECQFLAPVIWPANLVLCTRPIKLGQSSMTMEYAVFKRDGDSESSDDVFSCVAMGTGVVVLVDYRVGDKVLIEGSLRERIQAQISDEDAE